MVGKRFQQTSDRLYLKIKAKYFFYLCQRLTKIITQTRFEGGQLMRLGDVPATPDPPDPPRRVAVPAWLLVLVMSVSVGKYTRNAAFLTFSLQLFLPCVAINNFLRQVAP